MKTKYDIGDEVLVKAIVKNIRVDGNGLIKYSLYSENWTNLEKFSEEEIIGISGKEQGEEQIHKGSYIFDTREIDRHEVKRISEEKIKDTPNNKLIVRLVEVSCAILAKNGFGCKKDYSELLNISKELQNRKLLTDEDIEGLMK